MRVLNFLEAQKLIIDFWGGPISDKLCGLEEGQWEKEINYGGIQEILSVEVREIGPDIFLIDLSLFCSGKLSERHYLAVPNPDDEKVVVNLEDLVDVLELAFVE